MPEWWGMAAPLLLADGREGEEEAGGGLGELQPGCGGWARRISLEEASRMWGRGPGGSS